MSSRPTKRYRGLWMALFGASVIGVASFVGVDQPVGQEGGPVLASAAAGPGAQSTGGFSPWTVSPGPSDTLIRLAQSPDRDFCYEDEEYYYTCALDAPCCNTGSEWLCCANGCDADGCLGVSGSADCDVCTQALYNDVAYGINTSSLPRTYVAQSIAKYDNCAANAGGGCYEGDILRRTLAAECSDGGDDEAYRACIARRVP